MLLEQCIVFVYSGLEEYCGWLSGDILYMARGRVTSLSWSRKEEATSAAYSACVGETSRTHLRWIYQKLDCSSTRVVMLWNVDSCHL